MYKFWWPIVWQTSHHRLAFSSGRTIVQQRLQTAVTAAATLSSEADNVLQAITSRRPPPARTACESVISLVETAAPGKGGGEVSRLTEDARFMQLLQVLEKSSAGELEPLAIIRDGSPASCSCIFSF
jgi:hypothetical protein